MRAGSKRQRIKAVKRRIRRLGVFLKNTLAKTNTRRKKKALTAEPAKPERKRTTKAPGKENIMA